MALATSDLAVEGAPVEEQPSAPTPASGGVPAATMEDSAQQAVEIASATGSSRQQLVVVAAAASSSSSSFDSLPSTAASSVPSPTTSQPTPLPFRRWSRAPREIGSPYDVCLGATAAASVSSLVAVGDGAGAGSSSSRRSSPIKRIVGAAAGAVAGASSSGGSSSGGSGIPGRMHLQALFSRSQLSLSSSTLSISDSSIVTPPVPPRPERLELNPVDLASLRLRSAQRRAGVDVETSPVRKGPVATDDNASSASVAGPSVTPRKSSIPSTADHAAAMDSAPTSAAHKPSGSRLVHASRADVLAAVEMGRFVGRETARDVCVCLRYLLPFVSLQKAPTPIRQADGSYRAALPWATRADLPFCESHCYDIIRDYLLVKLVGKKQAKAASATSARGISGGKESRDRVAVGKKLEVLEIVFLSTGLLPLFDLARHSFDLPPRTVGLPLAVEGSRHDGGLAPPPPTISESISLFFGGGAALRRESSASGSFVQQPTATAASVAPPSSEKLLPQSPGVGAGLMPEKTPVMNGPAEGISPLLTRTAPSLPPIPLVGGSLMPDDFSDQPDFSALPASPSPKPSPRKPSVRGPSSFRLPPRIPLPDLPPHAKREPRNEQDIESEMFASMSAKPHRIPRVPLPKLADAAFLHMDPYADGSPTSHRASLPRVDAKRSAAGMDAPASLPSPLETDEFDANDKDWLERPTSLDRSTTSRDSSGVNSMPQTPDSTSSGHLQQIFSEEGDGEDGLTRQVTLRDKPRRDSLTYGNWI